MSDYNSSEQAVQGKVSGIIFPPPDIRAIVDKTALFVAKNGKNFEQKILNSAEGKTPKFNFMRPYDPYHAYYELKIRENEEGVVTQPKTSETVNNEENQPTEDSKQATSVNEARIVGASSSTSMKASFLNPLAKFALASNKPTESPYAFEFSMGHPQGLSALDVDVIKLTAQYTAINGRDFLGGLAQKELRNPQFDFLKPTHMLFSYFTSLVDAYAKILSPAPEIIARIDQFSYRANNNNNSNGHSSGGGAKAKLLESAVHRWDWNKMESEKKKRDELEADAERVAYQLIDWFDFVVVETIDFPEDELADISINQMAINGQSLSGVNSEGDSYASISTSISTVGISPRRVAMPPPPPPMLASFNQSLSSSSSSSSSVGVISGQYAQAQQQRQTNAGGRSSHVFQQSDDMDVDMDMEMEIEEREEANDFDREDITDDSDLVLNVVSDAAYVPRTAQTMSSSSQSQGPMMVDPISGKAIPASQMEEHMRVQLLDPKWRIEQKRFQEKQRDTGFAEGVSIAESLKLFARRRSDIFGRDDGADNTGDMDEDNEIGGSKQETIQWDGHKSSVSATLQMKSESAARHSQFQYPSASAPLSAPLPATTSSSSSSIGPTLMTAHLVHQSGAFIPPLTFASNLLPSLSMTMSMPTVLPVPPPPPAPLPLPLPMPLAPSLPLALPPPTESSPLPPAPAPLPPSEPIQPTKQNNLIPAEEFSQLHPGHVTIIILIPFDPAQKESTGWDFNGQQLSLTLASVSEATVKDIKDLICTQLGGMPASKQQLKSTLSGVFLKDSNTLAMGNIGSGAVLELSARSRGGGKR